MAKQDTLAAASYRRLLNERKIIEQFEIPGFIEIEACGDDPGIVTVHVHAESYVPGNGGAVLAEGPFTFVIECGAQYPEKRPKVGYKGKAPMHANVYPNTGNVCIGHWMGWNDYLPQLVLRIIRTTLLYPSTFNFNSPANHTHIRLCRELIADKKVPTDDRPLPCLE